jgi:hypothetical protein
MSDRSTHDATRLRDPDGGLVGSRLKPLPTRDDDLLEMLTSIRDELSLQTVALQLILEQLSGQFSARDSLDELTERE